MSKEDFLGLIQGEAFRKAIQASFIGPEFTKAVQASFVGPEFTKAVQASFAGPEFTKAVKASFADPDFTKAVQLAVAPQFEVLSDEMADFRDQVLTQEDATVRELKIMRAELASFSYRIQRVEQQT